MADEAEDIDSNPESFPGLNKTHGFFKAIERNQRDRDLYHKQTEVHNIKLDLLILIQVLDQESFCLFNRSVEVRQEKGDAETRSIQREASTSHLT